jgi:hypothetical protein
VIPFELSEAQRIQPAETFRFTACCLTEANGRIGG